METHLRWEPAPNLPEQMLFSVDVAFDEQGLTVTAHYDSSRPREPVCLRFGRIEAFKVYEEFSDCSLGLDEPTMVHPSLRDVPYPFQEVRQSEWVKRVVSRNGAISDQSWRHFVIVTKAVILHVMTDRDVQASPVSH